MTLPLALVIDHVALHQAQHRREWPRRIGARQGDFVPLFGLRVQCVLDHGFFLDEVGKWQAERLSIKPEASHRRCFCTSGSLINPISARTQPVGSGVLQVGFLPPASSTDARPPIRQPKIAW